MEVNPAELEGLVEGVIGWVAGLFTLGALLLLFRQAIENYVAGKLFKLSGGLAFDQPLLLSGRPARLIRVGLFRTIFYMSDRRSKMVVPNTQLALLTLECRLSEHPPALTDDD